MARLSIELRPFYVALILAFVGLCTIPAEVQSSSSSREVYRYLRAARITDEEILSSPRVCPPESRHGSTTDDLASPRETPTHVTTFPVSPVLLNSHWKPSAAAAEIREPHDHPGQRLHHLTISTFTMLPRGSVVVPPGPNLGSNADSPPPGEP